MNRKPAQRDLVVLPRPEFESLLEQAACRGARKALHEVGLNDENAASDLRDLRDLLSALQTAKKEVLQTFVRWLTLGFLLLILAGITSKMGWTK